METAKNLKVLVYGATGAQAKPTVEQLIKRGHHPRIITRSKARVLEVHGQGVEAVICDMADRECLFAATQGMDGVAFLLPAFLDKPAEAVSYGRNAIDAAAQAGVSMFVWNTSGPIPDDESDSKAIIFKHLKQSGVPYLLLEPTTYMENWLGPWTAPSLQKRNQLSYPVLAGRKMGWLACRDICALVVAALERPELAGNRYKVSGIEAPVGPELARMFSRALGRTITYYAMAPEEMGAVLDRLYGPGSGDRIAEMYRKEQNDPDPEPNYHDMTPVLQALPVTMTDIETWVKAHAHHFI